jgi:hypothetical protein
MRTDSQGTRGGSRSLSGSYEGITSGWKMQSTGLFSGPYNRTRQRDFLSGFSPLFRCSKTYRLTRVDEGRKRVIAIMAAILTSLHMQTADDLFGGPQGSPRTEKLISASVQWAEEIMRKIDSRWPS